MASKMAMWFRDSFNVTRKNYTDTFGAEPFAAEGTIKGFMQPITGRLSQRLGKDAAEASHLLYCDTNAGIDVGDRITDTQNRVWIAQFVQVEGIAGIGDHQEIAVELSS